MASDYLAAGVAGGLTGISDMLGKYYDSELASKRKQRDLLAEQAIWEARLPLTLAQKQKEEDMTLARTNKAYQYEVNNPKPKVVDPNDQISGADMSAIASGNPDPTKSYSKSLVPVLNQANKTANTPTVDKVDEAYKIRQAQLRADAEAGNGPKADKDISKIKNELSDARAAASVSIPELDRIAGLNKDSSGGFFGSTKQKTMSAFNMTSPTFENTADVTNSLKNMVAKVLKSTFGAQLSDGEREYLNSVFGAAEKYSVSERDIAVKNIKNMFTSRITEKENKFRELTGEEPPASNIKNPNENIEKPKEISNQYTPAQIKKMKELGIQ